MEHQIIPQQSPLRESDCFYLSDRYKDFFNFPMHTHDEIELNFVENCQGAMRLVGDSAEELGPVDLAIIPPHIPHTYEQHNCQATHIREITILFPAGLLDTLPFGKTAIEPIRVMLDKVNRGGVAFPLASIMKVYAKIMDLTVIETPFYRVLKVWEILHDLAQANSSYSLDEIVSPGETSDACRVSRIRAYIREHFREEIRLPLLARMAGMTTTAFSRFFKMRTGRSITEYIIDMRLAQATRLLVDTDRAVSDICYNCGFNNVSNFNRIFKKKKGTSPNAFRRMYQRRKVVI